jgi:hypothetical protein
MEERLKGWTPALQMQGLEFISRPPSLLTDPCLPFFFSINLLGFSQRKPGASSTADRKPGRRHGGTQDPRSHGDGQVSPFPRAKIYANKKILQDFLRHAYFPHWVFFFF